MKKINIEEAKIIISEYKYAYLQMMSEHILDEVSKLGSIDWEELIEGYVFDNEKQLHFYRDDGDELVAVIIDDDMDDAHIIDRKYKLSEKYKEFGKNVIIREYLLPDEDGQSYVVATRLLGME